MKTLVIGGGMSGLVYGILSARSGNETYIYERNSRVGKKISMTGNGRCNIGNENLNERFYNKSKLVSRVLSRVSLERYKAFLKTCDILTFTDSEGRMYPFCESASNVVDCLRTHFVRSGGQIVCDCTVEAVEPRGGGYNVFTNGGKKTFFEKVVLCCGSGSSADCPNLDKIVDSKYFTPRVPSLVPVKVFNGPKTISGLRAKATVTLYRDGFPVKIERGEVQFKEYGLSGICIYNLSAEIARDYVQGKNREYSFVLDLVPKMTKTELVNILTERAGTIPPNEVKQCCFYGILHNKLAEYIIYWTKEQSAPAWAFSAKNLSFKFEKLLDYSMSQVTAGGVDEQFLDPEELTLPNGIVVLGEALNVDGVCGGYNLYFAAASALYLFDEQRR